MSPVAIALILTASLFQAGWNLVGKATRVSPGAFLAANAAGSMLLLPVALLYLPLLREMPTGVVAFLVATGFFEMLFYVSLSYAYREGELSIAFPLVRSLPILLVTAWGLLFRAHSRPSAIALVGYALIVIGSFLLPMRTLRGLQARSYLNLTMLFVLAAAVGVAGYSMIDSRALDLFRDAVGGGVLRERGGMQEMTIGMGLSVWRAPLVYSFLDGTSTTAWLALYVGVERRVRSARRDQVLVASGGPPGAAAYTVGRGLKWTARSGQSLVLGLGIFLTYTLILISMGLVRDVSYVVAFNQASIPIGVLFGLLFLGEEPFVPKIAGVAIMTAGLVLTALG